MSGRVPAARAPGIHARLEVRRDDDVRRTVFVIRRTPDVDDEVGGRAGAEAPGHGGGIQNYDVFDPVALRADRICPEKISSPMQYTLLVGNYTAAAAPFMTAGMTPHARVCACPCADGCN